MIYLKRPVTWANVNAAPEVVGQFRYAQWSDPVNLYGVKAQVERSRFVDRRDVDYQVWLVAVADPWFGRRKLWPAYFGGLDPGWDYPNGGGWLYGLPLEGFHISKASEVWRWPMYGKPVRALLWGGKHPLDETANWIYPQNYPVSVRIIVQPAGVQEPQGYTVAIRGEWWYGSGVNPRAPSDGSTLQQPVPVTVCNLTLSHCEGRSLSMNGVGDYLVSTATDNFGTATHWPATRVDLAGATIPTGGNKTLGWDGGVPSDLPGKMAHPRLEHEMVALYHFAARDAVEWTKAPAGTTVLFRTPAGVAPSVMICTEEFEHRYWEPGRYAETDRESYLICQAHFFRTALHHRVSYAVRRDATGAHARTSTRNLVERYLYPQPFEGYRLNYPLPPNSLQFFAHRRGRVEIDDTLQTMRATILAEKTVDGPGVDTPNLLAQSDGTLHLVYAKFDKIRHQVSKDGGETWMEQEYIAEGYEACAAALHGETGMLVVPMWREGPVDGSRYGEWSLTVGTLQADGTYSWSNPQVIRLWTTRPQDQVPLYAKPWGGSLVRQSDGWWIWTFVGPEPLFAPVTGSYLPIDIYQQVLRCRNLGPDGSGRWERLPRM